MKKNLFITNLLLFLVLFNSCSEIEVSKTDSKSEIFNDRVFKDYLLESSAHFKRNQNPEKIKKYISDNYLSPDEMNDIYLAFGYNSIEELNDYATNQNKRVKYLNDKFKIRNLSSSELNDIITTGCERFEIIENQYILSFAEANCGSKLKTCRGKAISASIAMHAGCAALDVTAIPGLICHEAALTYQYYALDECNLDYDACQG